MIASLWVEYSGSSLEAIPTECPLIPFGLLKVSDPCKITEALASLAEEFRHHALGKDPAPQAPRAPAAASPLSRAQPHPLKWRQLGVLRHLLGLRRRLPPIWRGIIACPAAEDLCAAKESDSLESGGEDWPDAYRHCPMNEDESLACLVVWWHHGWNAPAFQIYAGLLFGLPLAVTSFNRYSRFAEASSRRVALTVASSYFDIVVFRRLQYCGLVLVEGFGTMGSWSDQRLAWYILCR